MICECANAGNYVGVTLVSATLCCECADGVVAKIDSGLPVNTSHFIFNFVKVLEYPAA